MTHIVTVRLDDLVAKQVQAIADLLKITPEGVVDFALKMTIERLKELYPEALDVGRGPQGRC